MFTIYKEVFISALKAFIDERQTFFKVMTLPIILIFSIGYFEYTTAYNIYADILMTLVTIYLYTTIAVSTHRIVLLGSKSISTLGIFRWTNREWRFAIYLCLLALVISLPLTIFGFLELEIQIQGFPYFILFVTGLIVSRFSLVFPGIAVDELFTFSGSWKLTKGYSILILIVVVIYPIAITFLVSPINILNSLNPFLIIIEIILVSCVYRTVRNQAKNKPKQKRENENN